MPGPHVHKQRKVLPDCLQKQTDRQRARRQTRRGSAPASIRAQCGRGVCECESERERQERAMRVPMPSHVRIACTLRPGTLWIIPVWHGQAMGEAEAPCGRGGVYKGISVSVLVMHVCFQPGQWGWVCRRAVWACSLQSMAGVDHVAPL